MPGFNFTERVRKSLALAREEAARLGHEYVGTEHLLLGLVLEGEGVACTILANLKVEGDEIRAKIEQVITPGRNADGKTDLPYTSRAKHALELAMTEAREFGHSYVGTEHLLLGIIREGKGIGAQVLVHHGATLDRARADLVNVLKAEGKPRKSGEHVSTSVGALAPVQGDATIRPLLTISAALAVMIGLMLIFDARRFEARMGVAIDDYTETIAQAQGAILIGLGLMNWLARGVRDRTALWAILYGNLVVQAISLTIVLRALARGIIPAAGVGSVVLHVLLGGAFGWQLSRLKRNR